MIILFSSELIAVRLSLVPYLRLGETEILGLEYSSFTWLSQLVLYKI